MKIEQEIFCKIKGWETLENNSFPAASCNFVPASGRISIFDDSAICKNTGNHYPNAGIIMNSNSGEIYDTQVHDDTISHTAVYFDKAENKIWLESTPHEGSIFYFTIPEKNNR